MHMENIERVAAGLPATIGQVIRAYRTAKDWPQQQLADAVTATGVARWTQSTTAKVESGNRPITAVELFAVAAVLGVPRIGNLFGQEVQDALTSGYVEELNRLAREAITNARKFIAEVAPDKLPEFERGWEAEVQRVRNSEPAETVQAFMSLIGDDHGEHQEAD